MQIERHEPLAGQLIDAQMQQPRIWLERIIHCTHERDGTYVLQLCRATLCCLRRTLPASAGAALAARLPLFIRGMWYERWHPGETPLTCSSITEFVGCTRPLLHGHYAEAVMEEDVLAVLRALFCTFPETVDFARPHLPEELIRETELEG